MLLERNDVDPNIADKYGRTPLWQAVKKGRDGVVRIPLERSDVDPNTADDKYGRVPLLCAAESGNEGVVGMFCSKCERQGHNLFYVDNTAQVRGGLRGTLGEE